MGAKRKPGKKQLAVIDDMFSGEMDEQAILKKHGVSRHLYNRWLADEHFNAEFDRRIAWAHRQGQLMIARYAPLAAAKLVQLTESEKEETARKACMDIISLPITPLEARVPPSAKPQEKKVGQLSPETAGKLLAVLAEEKKVVAKAQKG